MVYLSKLLQVLVLVLIISQLTAGQIQAKNNYLFLPVFAVLNPVPTPEPEGEIAPSPSPTPTQVGPGKSWLKFKHKDIIEIISKKYDLDPQLIYATIMTESGGNERAYRYEPHLDEPSLCMGQILVSTARGLGFKGDPLDIYDPEICIDLIGKYYRYFLDDHAHLSARQLACAYNSGSPGRRCTSGHLPRFSKFYYEES